MLTCPDCGILNEDGSAYCDQCGAALTGRGSPQDSVGPAETGDGYRCPQCRAPVIPGEAFCETCGAVLKDLPLPPAGPVGSTTAHPTRPSVQPPSAANRAVLLVVDEGGAPLPFPADQTEVVVGREDSASNVFPDINLEKHRGEEGGVSRRHAMFSLRGDQWYIEDLNSTNFTYVNKKRLQTGRQYPVLDGDEILLGNILLSFSRA